MTKEKNEDKNRNHLNNIDQMVQLVNNFTSSNEDKSRMKRSVSYKLLEMSNSNNYKRTYATKTNKTCKKELNKEYTQSNLNSSKHSFALEDAGRNRMKSESPSRYLNGKNVQASHQSILEKLSVHEANKMHLKVFDFRKVNYVDSKASPKNRMKTPTNNELNSSEKVITRLRSLRYKSSNNEDGNASASDSNRPREESLNFRNQSISEEKIHQPEENQTQKAEVYISNFNFINGYDSYFARRKQPRQAKKH